MSSQYNDDCTAHTNMCSLNFHIIPHCMKCEYNMLTNNGVFCNRTCISIAVCTQKYICSASLQSSGFFIFFFWFGEIIVQFGLFVCIQFHQKVSYQHKHHAHCTVHTHTHTWLIRWRFGKSLNRTSCLSNGLVCPLGMYGFFSLCLNFQFIFHF